MSDGIGPEGSRLTKLRWLLRTAAAQPREQQLRIAVRLLSELFSLPIVILNFFVNADIHPGYGLTWRKRLWLAWRIYSNSLRVVSLVSYKSQLMMAVKLFEIPPEVDGVVVECGCFVGGTSASLSLACALAGRRLIIYDSFEGMPAPLPGETIALAQNTGGLRGSLETVRKNIDRVGNLDVCTFRKGWFADVLPAHREPIVLLLIDVDYEASLHDCVRNLWPHLVPGGWLFLDDLVYLDLCALFFSERYWQQYFNERPPGLMGAGTGVGVGQYYWGPWLRTPMLQFPNSIAYTWKGNSGFWSYYPEDIAGDAPAPEPGT